LARWQAARDAVERRAKKLWPDVMNAVAREPSSVSCAGTTNFTRAKPAARRRSPQRRTMSRMTVSSPPTSSRLPEVGSLNSMSKSGSRP
jgi:hypothetical protein